MKALLFVGLFLAQQFAVHAGQNPPAPAKLSVPVLGYAFDADAGLRPIRGIPGASLLGAPVDPGVKVLVPVAALDRDFFLGITAEDGKPAVMILDAAGSFVRHPVPDASPGADAIRVSPGGSAAVVLNQAASCMEVIAGLPDRPAVTRRIDLSGLAFAPRAIAVSDDARYVVAAPAADEGSSPVWFGPDGGPHTIPVPAASAAAFAPGSHNALFVSPAQDQIWLVSAIGGETAYRAIPGYGLARSAVAAEFSTDGRRFYAAGAGGAIMQFDIAGGIPAAASCGCAVAGLERLRGDSVFLLRGSGANPLYLLDGASGKPRIVFTPLEGVTP